MNLPSRVLLARPHGKPSWPIAQTQEELRERIVKACEAIGNGWMAPAIAWGTMVGIVAVLVLTFLSTR